MTKTKSSLRVAFRRRREGKTDYYRRKELLKSKALRLAIRTSLSHVNAQFVKSQLDGDFILVAASSKELSRRYGWKAPTGNLPAAYLTGLLAGLKARKKGIKEAILDVGVRKPLSGTRLYSTLKGILDAGISIPTGEAVLPDESRIQGEHIIGYAKTLTDPEIRRKHFSSYLNASLQPEDITSNFYTVKSEIEKSFIA